MGVGPSAVEHDESRWVFAWRQIGEVASAPVGAARVARIQERGVGGEAENWPRATDAIGIDDPKLNPAEAETRDPCRADGVPTLVCVLQDDDGSAIVDRLDAVADAGDLRLEALVTSRAGWCGCAGWGC